MWHSTLSRTGARVLLGTTMVALVMVLMSPSQALAADAYEVDNTAAQAKPLVVGATAQSRTLPEGDIDWVSIDVTVGVTYAIETGQGGPENLDTYVTLYDSDGTTKLAENDDSGWTGHSLAAWTANASKTIFAKVEGFKWDSGSDDYLLEAREAKVAMSGRITDATNGSPIADGLALVMRDDGMFDEYVAMAQCDPSGNYLVVDIPAGNYLLEFGNYDFSYWPEYYDDALDPFSAETITYNGSTPRTGLDAALDPFGAVGAVERIWDDTRFSTAVEIARTGFDPAGDRQWDGVRDVVIASGDDRAAADPLAASGLCWVYDAPLMLVSASHTPSEVKQAIREIVAANGPVTLHIVGGPVSVPDARISDITRAVGSSKVSAKRVVSKGDRYTVAAEIARLVDAEWARCFGPGESPDTVLVANGADPTKFFDALALSPIAAANGYPILLCSADSVPSATKNALASLDPERVIIGGGPKTVTAKARSQLGSAAGVTPEQWYGADRYSTATRIASNAVYEALLTDTSVGVAAKLPDALTGGSMSTRTGGVLLLTDGMELTSTTGYWLNSRRSGILECSVFGGPRSVDEMVLFEIEAILMGF